MLDDPDEAKDKPQHLRIKYDLTAQLSQVIQIYSALRVLSHKSHIRDVE